jgi:uncharacterized glyoxalase superfamily protein PhnB
MSKESTVRTGGMLDGRELSASLTVADLGRSVAWYRDVIGFAEDRRHERDGRLQAVSLRADNVRLLLGQDDGARGAERVEGEGMSLMITVAEGVDEIAKRITDSGGTLELEPTDAPWGARVFRVRDPDGFRLTFSTVR